MILLYAPSERTTGASATLEIAGLVASWPTSGCLLLLLLEPRVPFVVLEDVPFVVLEDVPFVVLEDVPWFFAARCARSVLRCAWL